MGELGCRVGGRGEADGRVHEWEEPEGRGERGERRNQTLIRPSVGQVADEEVTFPSAFGRNRLFFQKPAGVDSPSSRNRSTHRFPPPLSSLLSSLL